jgi:hypothetical protein
MIKDALLQYTGMVKVFPDESETRIPKNFKGLDRLELAKLRAQDDFKIEEEGEEEEPSVDGNPLFFAKGFQIGKTKKIGLVNIPPEEMLINDDARDFERPRFIGHRTPKTRSALVEMGFDKDVVYGLPANEGTLTTDEGAIVRRLQFAPENSRDNSDPSQEEIWLGEYYMPIDVNEDGVAEYYKLFYAGSKLIKAPEAVDDHPFGVAVPIPMPHVAIGSCPAEQTADIQQTKSALIRQMNNNVYQNNYGGHAVNENVELDDLLTPRAAMVVRTNSSGPVGNDIMPLVTPPIIGEILAAVEYWDSAREVRTGVTRHNQGLDADSLNKTATGFKGMMDASQQRMYLQAVLMSLNGITQLMEKIIKLAGRHQNEKTQIRIFGEVIDIDPMSWSENLRCEVDVGIGVGDRNEKIQNLFTLYQEQKQLKAAGSAMTDESKMFASLDEIVVEIGLKDGSKYFNDTSKPDETLKAENEYLQQVTEQLGQQNPLAEAEQVKADAAMAIKQADQEARLQELLVKIEQARADSAQQADEFQKEMLFKLTELEAKTGVDVPGSSIGSDADFVYDPQTGRIRANATTGQQENSLPA